MNYVLVLEFLETLIVISQFRYETKSNPHDVQANNSTSFKWHSTTIKHIMNSSQKHGKRDCWPKERMRKQLLLKKLGRFWESWGLSISRSWTRIPNVRNQLGYPERNNIQVAHFLLIFSSSASTIFVVFTVTEHVECGEQMQRFWAA